MPQPSPVDEDGQEHEEEGQPRSTKRARGHPASQAPVHDQAQAAQILSALAGDEQEDDGEALAEDEDEGEASESSA